MSETTSRFRPTLIVSLAGFALLWLRLFDLQVIHHDHYARIADENRIQWAVDIAPRGLLRDRHGLILAQNDPSYSVYLMRSKAVPRDAVVANLARILERDSSEITEQIRTSYRPDFEPVRVARHVPLETVCRIEEQNELLPGILLRYETRRRYPQPSGGSHLLGYLTETSRPPEEEPGDAGSFTGVRGVERQYNEKLRGLDGVSYFEVTAAGQVVGKSKDHPSKSSTPGADLVLTVDWALQEFATEALARRGKGSVICLDPRTGEVRALVNVPGFDPNLFSGTLRQEDWDSVVSDTTHPLLDRALRGLYPPGSTTKLVTAGAALELGLIAPSTTFSPCFGGMQFGNRYFRCWKAAGHGSSNLTRAVERSCDVYFYQLAQRLGLKQWARFASRCGFGSPTGIDLPDEAGGLVPDSAFYDRRFGRRRWSRNLVLNVAIGQGEFLATPLQVAHFYAALANNGIAPRPRVAKVFRMGAREDSVQTTGGELRLPFSPETIATLRRALRQVVAGPEGTARGLNYPDLDVAGKTGTAQNPHGENHSWFACYAPADEPEIVVVALVENAGEGSEVAAPLCGEVLRYFFGLAPAPKEPPLAPGQASALQAAARAGAGEASP